ncbi:MAG: hypothetical protein IK141_06925 [Clostridia bacterium]|nr:hypothetical protein [Clostridia bacterium]
MDERIDLKKSGKLKDNITRFRQDKRLAVVGALRSLALLGMLAIVVFCIFRYHEDLAPSNLKRLSAYLKTANAASDPFTEYRFESGLNTCCAPFRTGLAVISGDTYSFVSGTGNLYSLQLDYRTPAICASDKYVLIYDRGGKSFCVANSYAEYLRDALTSPIISASMNRESDFALVTNEEGYRSAVTVYNGRQKFLCKWMTSQFYVLSASVSPRGDAFAALCLSEEQLEARTEIRYFTIGRETPDWSFSLGEKQVYSLTHDNSGGLLILCDDGLYRLDKDGRQTASIPFSAPPIRFSAQEGGDLLIAFSNADQGAQNTLVWVVGDEGRILWRDSYPGTLCAVDCAEDTACVLTGDRLYAVRYRDENQPRHWLAHSGARDVVVHRAGNPILIYSDRAETVAFAEKEGA